MCDQAGLVGHAQVPRRGQWVHRYCQQHKHVSPWWLRNLLRPQAAHIQHRAWETQGAGTRQPRQTHAGSTWMTGLRVANALERLVHALLQAQPVTQCEHTQMVPAHLQTRGLQEAERCAVTSMRRTRHHAAVSQPAAQLHEAERQRRLGHRVRHALYAGPAFGVAAVGCCDVKVQPERWLARTLQLGVCARLRVSASTELQLTATELRTTRGSTALQRPYSGLQGTGQVQFPALDMGSPDRAALHPTACMQPHARCGLQVPGLRPGTLNKRQHALLHKPHSSECQMSALRRPTRACQRLADELKQRRAHDAVYSCVGHAALKALLHSHQRKNHFGGTQRLCADGRP